MTRILGLVVCISAAAAGAGAQQRSAPPPPPVRASDTVTLLAPAKSPPPSAVAPRAVAPSAVRDGAAPAAAAPAPLMPVSAPVESRRPVGVRPETAPPADATMRCKNGNYITGVATVASCAQFGGVAAILPSKERRPNN